MSPQTPSKQDAKTAPIVAICVFCLAFVHAICLIQSNVDRQILFSAYMSGDTDHYLNHAESLVLKGFQDDAPPFHPPGTAVYLAGVLLLTGPGVNNPFVVKLSFVLLFALTTALTALLAFNLSGSWAAWVAGVLTAFSFGLAVLGSVPSSEIMYLPLLIGTTLLLISRKNDSILSVGICGVLSGVAWLVRGEHFLLIPLICVVASGVFDRSLSLKKKGTAVVVFVLALLVVVGPWTVRNAKVMNGLNRKIMHQGMQQTAIQSSERRLPVWVPVTLYGQLNFALANLPPSTGEFTRAALPLSNGSTRLNFHDPVHRKFVSSGYVMGMSALLDDPVRAIRLIANKLDLASRGLSNGFTRYNWPGGLTGIRRPVDVFTPNNTWFRWVVLSVMGVGFFLLFRQNRRVFWFFLVLVIHRIVVVALFYGYARHGLLLWPIGAVLAGILVAGAAQRFRWKSWVSLLFICCVLVLLFADGWKCTSPVKLEVDYVADPITGRPDQQQTMRFRADDL